MAPTMNAASQQTAIQQTVDNSLHCANNPKEPSTLASIMLEIQHTIIKNLNYPDLIRLQMTCRIMRDLPTESIKRFALEKLEEDWITAAGEKTDKKFRYQLIRSGYKMSDMRRIYFFTPCYTCLTIKKSGCFEDAPRNGPTSLYLYYRQRFGSIPTIPQRKCVDCLLKNIDLRQKSSRHIDTKTRTILACRKCNKIKNYVHRRVQGLQREGELCHRCFKDDKAKLAKMTEEIKQARKEFAELLSKIKHGNIDRAEYEQRRENLLQMPEMPDFESLRYRGRVPKKRVAIVDSDSESDS